MDFAAKQRGSALEDSTLHFHEAHKSVVPCHFIFHSPPDDGEKASLLAKLSDLRRAVPVDEEVILGYNLDQSWLGSWQFRFLDTGAEMHRVTFDVKQIKSAMINGKVTNGNVMALPVQVSFSALTKVVDKVINIFFLYF